VSLRARADQGTIPFAPETYGHSRDGIPLQVWKPAGRTEVLVFAGIHGDEPETTGVLSKALRRLSEPPPHCAVVLAANPDGLLRGTRGNALGVELNRNFATRDWSPELVAHRLTLREPRDVLLSPGAEPASEPETRALVALVEELEPEAVVALHAPLACIDDPGATPLGRWLSLRTGLPLVDGVGYPTPGSFGTWAAERDLAAVTYELPPASPDDLARQHVPALVDLLTERSEP
jgi:murein peptide amidase A